MEIVKNYMIFLVNCYFFFATIIAYIALIVFTLLLVFVVGAVAYFACKLIVFLIPKLFTYFMA